MSKYILIFIILGFRIFAVEYVHNGVDKILFSQDGNQYWSESGTVFDVKERKNNEWYYEVEIKSGKLYSKKLGVSEEFDYKKKVFKISAKQLDEYLSDKIVTMLKKPEVDIYEMATNNSVNIEDKIKKTKSLKQGDRFKVVERDEKKIQIEVLHSEDSSILGKRFYIWNNSFENELEKKVIIPSKNNKYLDTKKDVETNSSKLEITPPTVREQKQIVEDVWYKISRPPTNNEDFLISSKHLDDKISMREYLFQSNNQNVEFYIDSKSKNIVFKTDNEILLGQWIVEDKSKLKKFILENKMIKGDKVSDGEKQILINYGRITDEEVINDENQDTINLCPKPGNYKLDGMIYYLSNKVILDDISSSIPAGSIISVEKTSKEGVKCSIKIIKSGDLKKEEIAKINSKDIYTYSSNLNPNNLTAIKNVDVKVPGKGEVIEFLDDPSLSGSDLKYYSSVIFKKGEIYKVLTDDSDDHRGLILSDKNNHEVFVYINELEDELYSGTIGKRDLETFNSVVDLVLNKDHISETVKPCIECNKKEVSSSEPITWGSCKKKDGKSTDYLDTFFNDRKVNEDDLLKDPESNEIVACIKNSISKGSGIHHLPDCSKTQRIRQEKVVTIKKENEEKKYTTNISLFPVPAPCASKKLSTIISDSFIRTMNCLSLDPKEIFPLISHESHFHPNVMSSSGALSVGQIIPSRYIELRQALARAKNKLVDKNDIKIDFYKTLSDTNKYSIEVDSLIDEERKAYDKRSVIFSISEYHKQLLGQDPNCVELLNLANDDFWNKTNTPSKDMILNMESNRLCGEGNPDREFLLAGISYQFQKKHAVSLLLKYNEKMSKKKLSDEQIEKISIVLAQWMHNGGIGGITVAFEFFLDELEKNNILKRDDLLRPIGGTIPETHLSDLSIKEIKKYLGVHIKQKYRGSRNRKNEVASYINKIDTQLKDIEKGGRECGYSL